MMKRYIKDILISIEKKTIKSNSIFIKHYNNFNIYKEDINLELNNDYIVLYHEYNSKFLQSAYEPILMWISDLYFKYFKEVNIYDFLRRCNVYSLHVSIFKSIIEKNIARREEDIIISEIDYESERMIDSIFNILNYISKKIQLIIVLNKLHLANLSTIKFIHKLIERNKDSNILLLATYNEAYDVESYMQEEWKELLVLIDNQELLEYTEVDSDYMYIEKQSSFIPKALEVNDYIKIINNMIFTLALDEAAYYLDMIYSSLSIENTNIDNDVKIKFLLLFALVNVYKNNISKALLLCDRINPLIENIDNLEYSFDNAYIYCIAQVQNEKYLLAKDYASKCTNIAEKMQDDYYRFKAKLLIYMVLFRGWKGLFLCEINYKIDKSIFSELEKYNYRNHLAYLEMLIYEAKDDFEINNFLSNEDFCYIDKSVSIAKELGNDNFLIEAYLKVAIMSSCSKRYDEVEKFYLKCLEIIKKRNNKSIEVEILNGLGYNLIVGGYYEKSNENFNNSIKILYEINDIEKIAEVLYNMGINALNARDYRGANEFFSNSLKIIEYIDIGCIKVCNISKIYGLVSLCNYYLGTEYACYEYFNKMKRILMHLLAKSKDVSTKLWDDDLFLYYLMNAIIHKKQNNIEVSKESFNKARKYMEISKGSLFYSYPILSLEEAKFYREIGQEEKSKELLSECIEYCKKEGYKNKAEYLQAFYNNEQYINKDYKLTLKSGSLKLIFDLAKRISAEKKLQEKDRELSFLLLWQNTLNKEQQIKEKLIEKAMVTMQNNFNVEGMIYISRVQLNEWRILYKDKDTNIENKDISKIIKYFQNNRKEFVVCRNDRNYIRYREIVNIIGINKVYSILGIPVFDNEILTDVLIAYIPVYNNFLENKIPLKEIHLYIISYMFKQLLGTINKIQVREEIEKMNERLNQLAITDQLTGLFNRQGFEKKIKEEVEDKITILYIDLDNFKYYNDTYGHNVGDSILVIFADLLKRVLKENDGYAVRYGGDEFILVIQNGNNKKGEIIAKSILSEMNREEFKQLLKSFIKSDENNIISCSIGVATSDGNSKESVYEAIKQSDKALYSVKNAQKNSYKIY